MRFIPVPVRRQQQKEQPAPSEWQIDSSGKRYRMIGYIKEYAPTVILSDGHEVYQDELTEFHELNKDLWKQQNKSGQNG